jgi:hypothetical protein
VDLLYRVVILISEIDDNEVGGSMICGRPYIVGKFIAWRLLLI